MTDFDLPENLDNWSPPEDVVTHGACEVPENMHFFRNPPADIGEVKTAWSTLDHGKQPVAMGTRFFLACITAVIIIAVGVFIGESPFDIVCYIAGPVVGICIWAALGFKHTCSYVGVEGLARYVLKGSLESEPAEEVLVFSEAADLTSGQTRHYTNGMYTGTHYNFVWQAEDGCPLLKLHGHYKAKDGFPKEKDPFHFARVGEVLWNDHLTDRMQAELDQHGSVEFPVNKNDFVRVGPGFLEFDFKGNVQQVRAEEIKKLNVSGGTFTIHTNDAGWFGSTGKFSFNYGQLGNASMFIFALERLLGYEFD